MNPSHRVNDNIIMPLLICLFAFLLIMPDTPALAAAKVLEPFSATPDQVLVIYNDDWQTKSAGSTTQDSKDIAQYYVRMHTDSKTGKKPHILGLSCQHFGHNHLNSWFIKEASTDNATGIVFTGTGKAPADLSWVRDSRKVEIHVTDPDADWNSVSIKCRSEQTGEETVLTMLRRDLLVSGIPVPIGDKASYPPVEEGKGRCFRLNAAQLFRGAVTVTFSIKNTHGKIIRDQTLTYYDARDFSFSPTGKDGVPDDKITQEDILEPIRKYLEDPKNALPDGTLLRDHILYIVIVHGMPYAVQGVFGIDHGVTANRGDHGSFCSLDQRLQTLYYDWANLKPPLIPFYMSGGPDADQGVINYIITTLLRRPLMGLGWNPYMHPDAYSFLRKNAKGPSFQLLPPFSEQRRTLAKKAFAYSVARIDGANPEEAKRLIDYARYATRYLRPEMDCRVREELAAKNATSLGDLGERLRLAEEKNLWGDAELEFLGFPKTVKNTEPRLPFMARPGVAETGQCDKAADWPTNGFYPGGTHHTVISDNGLNITGARVWQQLAQGVTVTSAGSPAYGGGPHITNTTFGDYAILMKYLLRGRDLGECFLRSSMHVNWSTSFIGDPLYHPDLAQTVSDTTPPQAAGEPVLTFAKTSRGVTVVAAIELKDDQEHPEVALLRIIARDPAGKKTVATSLLYSRRPQVALKELLPDTEYDLVAELVDPYGNQTTLSPQSLRTPSIIHSLEVIKEFIEKMQRKK